MKWANIGRDCSDTWEHWSKYKTEFANHFFFFFLNHSILGTSLTLGKHWTPSHPQNKADDVMKYSANVKWELMGGFLNMQKWKIWAAGNIITKHNQSISELTRSRSRTTCQTTSGEEIHPLAVYVTAATWETAPEETPRDWLPAARFNVKDQ